LCRLSCCCVTEPPQWTENTSATRHVFVNGTSQLSHRCTARGNPAPVIVWTKDGQTLDVSGTAWYTVDTAQRPVDTYSTSVTSILFWKGNIIGMLNECIWRKCEVGSISDYYDPSRFRFTQIESSDSIVSCIQFTIFLLFIYYYVYHKWAKSAGIIIQELKCMLTWD